MLTLTWFGTASLALKCDEGSLLLDPFLPLPGGEAPTQLQDFDGYPDILITHGHVDHIATLPQIYKRNRNIRIFCTARPYETLLKKGIPTANLMKLTYKDTLELNGFSVTLHHGRHAVLPKASGKQIKRVLTGPHVTNLPWIAKEALACTENDETVFYEIRVEGKTLSIMGSMNLREEETYPTGSDYLILPYNGWEDNFTPAVQIIERLQPKQILLDHYDDTFPPLSGPVDRKPILEKYGMLIRELRYEELELK